MIREAYKNLSKEQLLYLISQYEDSMFFIGEACVDESKQEIDPHTAIKHIRNNIFTIPKFGDERNISAWIDMRRGIISPEKYRKILLGE